MKFHQAKQLAAAINQENYEPNDWENNFIESVLNRQQDLTAKQSGCLQSIYSKAVGGGVYQKKERF